MTARLAAVAAAHARMLARRRTPVALLPPLPLAFYGALYRHSPHTVTVGGVASAFSADGAAIFSMLPARAADQRLALTGYQTAVLIGGQLIVLEAASILISLVTAAVMITGTGPARPADVVAGVILTGIAAVPLGLALGALLPRELEAVLILIGIVGIQITARPDGVISALLPFQGPASCSTLPSHSGRGWPSPRSTAPPFSPSPGPRGGNGPPYTDQRAHSRLLPTQILRHV